jgi:hypothetical protein
MPPSDGRIRGGTRAGTVEQIFSPCSSDALVDLVTRVRGPLTVAGGPLDDWQGRSPAYWRYAGD